MVNVRRRAPRLWILAAVLAGIPAAARAQDSLITIRPTRGSDSAAVVPFAVLMKAIGNYNDSAASRFTGGFTLPAGNTMTGKVALFRGHLRVYGRLVGPVTVISGDLIVANDGIVEGDVLVVGGRIDVRDRGRITGRKESYEGRAAVYRAGTGLLAVRDPRRPLGELARARTSFTAGGLRTVLTVETGKTYNRVEGLPIVFGPTIYASGASPEELRVELRGIFRPATDRTQARDDLGFIATAEVGLGGEDRPFRFGARGYRRIVPIEDQPLDLGESGWSAFLLQRDYRDHYDAQGIEGFASVGPFSGLRFSASIRRDLERSVPASDPISFLRNTDSWRPNPLIDDGTFRTLRVGLDLDTRNDTRRPTSGWRFHVQVENSLSNDASPVTLPADVRPAIAPGRYAFSRLWFDVRRYARFNPAAQVALRVVGGGWLAGDPLPVQRRVSLGGPDIMPGFGFRDLNCAPPGFVDQSRMSLCDRMLAIQLETRLDLNLGSPIRLRNPELFTLQQLLGIEQADLVLFANAGKAWLTGQGPSRVPNNRIPVISEWDLDAGVGLDAGGIGLYLARAVSGDQPFRFAIRLKQRF